MLERALRAISEGEACDTAALTQLLQVSVPQVQDMIVRLAQLGYLETAQAACVDSCASCSGTQACPPAARMWRLTAKAAAILGKR